MSNPFAAVLVSAAGTRAEPGRLVLEIRLPWYRSMPLSVVEIGEVVLDGRTIPLDGARFKTAGQAWTLPELREQTDRYWFVQDSAFLALPVAGLDADTEHHVSFVLKLFPPYIPMLTWITRGEKALKPATAKEMQ